MESSETVFTPQSPEESERDRQQRRREFARFSGVFASYLAAKAYRVDVPQPGDDGVIHASFGAEAPLGTSVQVDAGGVGDGSTEAGYSEAA